MNPLTARDLSLAYGSEPILKQLSLELRSGEVLVLLGSNGAGKTTLLRALCRQLSPDSGAVLIDQKDIREFNLRTLSKTIALMPQQENRDAQLTVLDVVSLGRTPHTGWWMPLSQLDRDIVKQSLEATGLSSLVDRRITELSGGEWRRMILARALTQMAPILLLDEPTAGLDLKYQFDVLSRVKKMSRQSNLTVVLTLHDLNQASIFGDRLAILCDGKILAVGAPRDVLRTELIEQAFGVPVSVMDHPIHGTPFVVPLYESISNEVSSTQAPPNQEGASR
jgi:iron complex transport system ATP-binding protein